MRGRRGDDDSEEGGREIVMKWMERNEGGEVVRRRIERKEGERQCVGGREVVRRGEQGGREVEKRKKERER